MARRRFQSSPPSVWSEGLPGSHGQKSVHPWTPLCFCATPRRRKTAWNIAATVWWKTPAARPRRRPAARVVSERDQPRPAGGLARDHRDFREGPGLRERHACFSARRLYFFNRQNQFAVERSPPKGGVYDRVHERRTGANASSEGAAEISALRPRFHSLESVKPGQAKWSCCWTRANTCAGARARRHSFRFAKWQRDFRQGAQGRSRRKTVSSRP